VYVFQTLAAASSFLVYIPQMALVYLGRISRLSRPLWFDGHNFDLYRCVDLS